MNASHRRGWGCRAPLLLGLVAIAGTASAAQVDGRVIGPDGGGVALPVLLEVHDGQQVVYTAEAVSSADGSVRWGDVPEAEGLLARLRATYEGAEYMSPAVALEGGAGALELTVLPVARDGRPLHLDTLHLIVQADEPGLLRVLQFMTVSNAGAAAFAGGPQLADGRPAGLVIPLPAGAANVRPAPFPTPESALDPPNAEFGSDRVLDARPVPPVGRQVAVTYELETSSGRLDLELLLPYPTQTASLLLGGAVRDQITLRSDQLQLQEPEMIGEDQYDLWSAEALAPGTELAFTFAPPGISLSVERISILSVGIALLVAVAGSVFGGRSRGHAERQRAALVRAIADLDEAHAAGNVEWSEYFHRRGRELEKLSLLDDDARAADSAPA